MITLMLSVFAPFPVSGFQVENWKILPKIPMDSQFSARFFSGRVMQSAHFRFLEKALGSHDSKSNRKGKDAVLLLLLHFSFKATLT